MNKIQTSTLLKDIQVTLDEDQNTNTQENKDPNEEQEPETPEDILNSPTKNQGTDDTNGEKAQ